MKFIFFGANFSSWPVFLYSIDLTKKNFQALTGNGSIAEQRVLLIKPQTFMNLSGRAAAAAMHYHHIALDHILVVTDDLNLPLGKLRLRVGGSDGGHNGLKSVAESLASKEYARLRFGVSEPPREEREQRGTADFVLRPFSTDEWPLVEKTVGRAADCIETFIREGAAAAMNQFNRGDQS